MITVKSFECNQLQENTYVVSDETRECVIIDCGAYYNEECQAIRKYIDTQQFLLLTVLIGGCR